MIFGRSFSVFVSITFLVSNKNLRLSLQKSFVDKHIELIIHIIRSEEVEIQVLEAF